MFSGNTIRKLWAHMEDEGRRKMFLVELGDEIVEILEGTVQLHTRREDAVVRD